MMMMNNIYDIFVLFLIFSLILSTFFELKRRALEESRLVGAPEEEDDGPQ